MLGRRPLFSPARASLLAMWDQDEIYWLPVAEDDVV